MNHLNLRCISHSHHASGDQEPVNQIQDWERIIPMATNPKNSSKRVTIKHNTSCLLLVQLCRPTTGLLWSRIKVTILKSHSQCYPGGVKVSMLAIGLNVRGFKPGQGHGFLRVIKIRSTISFGRKVKLLAQCHKILGHVKGLLRYDRY
jgi:hypothetical protein